MVASVYQSAYTFLKNVADDMNRVFSGFTNVKIRMHSAASETWGYDKTVKLKGLSAHENGFFAVQHELGHVLHHLASRDRYLGPDSSNKGGGTVYEACGGDNGHTFYSTDECKDAVTSEGFADMMVAISTQHPTANDPCVGLTNRGQACHSTVNRVDLETAVCPTGRDQESQVLRYLWDTYDPSRSTPRDQYDEILNAYQNGRSNHQKSENWCCTLWTCNPCDHDDKNIGDFNFHFEAVTGQNGSSLISNHCL